MLSLTNSRSLTNSKERSGLKFKIFFPSVRLICGSKQRSSRPVPTPTGAGTLTPRGPPSSTDTKPLLLGPWDLGTHSASSSHTCFFPQHCEKTGEFRNLRSSPKFPSSWLIGLFFLSLYFPYLEKWENNVFLPRML